MDSELLNHLRSLVNTLPDTDFEVWTSNSWRRVYFAHGGPAIEPCVQRMDNHPDLIFSPGVAAYIEAIGPKRVRMMLDMIEQQARDLAALREDIEAQIRIASEEATRADKLLELLKLKKVKDDEIEAWLDPTKDRRSVWFMYDCHVFARPDLTNPDTAFQSIRELFDEDRCGSIFVKRWPDGPAIRELDLSANYKENGYKVLDSEIREWVERYFAWKPDAALAQGKEG